MSPRAKTPKTWPHLEGLITSGGQVTLGEVGPISCAAIAADPHTMYAALTRRHGESLTALLDRLDHALDKALNEDLFTDEING